jgi:hypothetical protein
MTIAIFLSIISLILLLFSINFLYSSNTYDFSNQNNYNDISLAATNGTFTELEPRIQSSLEDDEETSITSDNETSQEAQTLQNQISYIENIIKTKFENKSSSYNSTNSNVSSKVN